MITKADLAQFYGTNGWIRWNPLLFPKVIASDGVEFIAENAGAYWLLDAIASHEMKNRKLLKSNEDPDFDFLHFWYLTVDLVKKKAKLECKADSTLPAVVSQSIGYTDFPLSSVIICAGNDGPGTTRKLFLMSER